MRNWKYKIFTLILMSWAFVAQATSPAHKNEISKTIHETFTVSSDVMLGIQNKYGDINISTWDKNQVDIEVLIMVEAGNESKAQKFLDGINIDFSSSSAKIGAKTVYPDQENSSWWSGWWNNGNNIDYEVIYTIKAPKGMSTELINKYGNVSQTSINGSTEVTNKYGDIYLQDIGGDVKVNLGYGKATIGNTGNAELDIKYSTVKLRDCGDVTMYSKYSNIRFGNCGKMELESKYDKFEIESAESINNNGKYDNFKVGDVNSFYLSSKYTDVRIKHLGRKAKFDTKYGSIVVNSSGNLEKFDVDSKYTDVKLGINKDFHLDFSGSYSGLSMEEPYEKYHYDKDGNSLEAKVYRGSKDANTRISVQMGYGKFIIKENN